MNNSFEFADDIQKCLEVLKTGGIILYPTDTIWGLGCDATNKAAVEKLYELKNRPENMSMIILVNSEPLIQQYVKDVPEIAWQILEVADKPITIIYPGAKNLAPNVIATDGSIGIRVCKEDFCSQLLFKFRKPLVSTSANFSGEKSPLVFSEISEELQQKVDYVVEYRQNNTEEAEPSSIIKLEEGNKFKIIRP